MITVTGKILSRIIPKDVGRHESYYQALKFQNITITIFLRYVYAVLVLFSEFMLSFAFPQLVSKMLTSSKLLMDRTLKKKKAVTFNRFSTLQLVLSKDVNADPPGIAAKVEASLCISSGYLNDCNCILIFKLDY